MPLGRVRLYCGAGSWKNVKVQFAVCATAGIVANSRQGNSADRVLRNIGVSLWDGFSEKMPFLWGGMPSPGGWLPQPASQSCSVNEKGGPPFRAAKGGRGCGLD